MAKMKAYQRKKNMPKTGGNPRQGMKKVKKKKSSVGTGGRLKFDLPGLKMKPAPKKKGKMIFGEYLKKMIKKNKNIKYPF